MEMPDHEIMSRVKKKQCGNHDTWCFRRLPNGMTVKQQNFADEYLRTGSACGAVRAVWNPGSAGNASSMARDNLKKPAVRFYIESQTNQLKQHLFGLALEAKSEQVQLGATINALDRVYGKAVQSTELTGANGGPISVQSLNLIYARALKLTDGGESGTDIRGAVGDNNPHVVS